MSHLSDIPTREFYMIRHGETEDNVAHRCSTANTNLTPRGWEQATQLRSIFNTHFGEKVGQCYAVSSELPRTVNTCATMLGHNDFRRDARLNERDNGRFGSDMAEKTLARLRLKGRPQRLAKILNRNQFETDQAQSDRVIVAAAEILRDCPQDKIPLIASHSGTMKKIAYALGINPLFDNAGLYHFVPPSNGNPNWSLTQVVMHGDKTAEVPVVTLDVPPPNFIAQARAI